MLVFTRRLDEAIVIGEDIEITVLRTGRDTVKLGITAPPSVAVHRREIYDLIRAENTSASGAPARLQQRGSPAGVPTPVSAGPSGVVCIDWRTADVETVAPLYVEERRRWLDSLGWETASSWQRVEAGRRSGVVDGRVAIDGGGTLVGWTFYLLHEGVLQVGAFVAASDLARDALLDHVFASAAAASARAITLFAYPTASGLARALTARGLAVEGYDYLLKQLTRLPAPAGSYRPWRKEDTAATAALFAKAYPGADVVRPFASNGTPAEWEEYVTQLVEKSGCGVYMPESSFVATENGRLAGAVLSTRLADKTAHIAQIVVAPEFERRGIGRLLLNAAEASAAASFCDRMSLLVGASNTKARHLYDAAGFFATGGFVAAGGTYPRRFTRVAVGGATSRR
jgi:carbon storage regulator